MSTGYEAELHSQAGRARRRRDLPERCPAPQFSPCGGGAWRHAVGHQPGGAALEARVGAALLVRTTRSVGLTEAGQRFLERAAPAFDELVAAGEAARELGQRPTGLLRLSVPRAVVPLILEPVIASFCQAYPEIELEIAASDEMVDLATGGFDAGIRLGQFIAPDMVAVRLTPPFPFVVVGSPDYLARDGRSAWTSCTTTPACACAGRTARSRPGALSMAARRSRQSSPGRSSRTTTPRSLERRSKEWGWRKCPARSPKRRLLTVDCRLY